MSGDAGAGEQEQPFERTSDVRPVAKPPPESQAALVWKLGERVKELSALHQVARLLNHRERSIGGVLAGVIALLPPAFQFPARTAARIRYGLHERSSEGFTETGVELCVSHTLSDGSSLELLVALKGFEGADANVAFLPEEQALVASVCDLVGGALDRLSAQERLELAVSETGAGVWDWDVSTGRVTWSEQMERLAGVEPGQFGGDLASFWSFVHPDDVQRLTSIFRSSMTDPNLPSSAELRLLLPNGGMRWIATSGRIFRDENGKPYRVLGLALDCTERRGLEDQLRQAQKMEAIGVLAAGVAHDFNNVLSVVLSYADLALLDLEEEHPIRPEIQEIHTAGRRASELTRHLLAFSRKQVLAPRVFELNRVLGELEKMLRRLLTEQVSLRLVFSPELGRVRADPGQVEQVVVNLVVNARDAMPNGGELTLQTSNVELTASEVEGQHEFTPGSYVRLAVSDSGVGMSPETKARIFEPFFTTKELGKGTGLGLATVFGIVRQSGGHIVVHSEIGRGTSFEVYLPRVELPADDSVALPPSPETLTGDETILLVEDEAQVRALAAKILRRNGYVVLEASNAGEAMLLCERHADELNLLVTDLILPLLSGRELAERVLALRPGLKVLYMSGYTDDAIIHHGMLEPGMSFIQKPLTPSQLLTKVRGLLDFRDRARDNPGL